MMSILDQLASSLGRRDNLPNQALAKQLVKNHDVINIREIVDNLEHQETAVQNDCIKVLYEIGYLDPALIADYWETFLELLESKNNRLVWGGMIALATIASIKADVLYPQRGKITTALGTGSVIVKDNAVKVLATIAGEKEVYQQTILPILFAHLKRCGAKDVPQHAESTAIAINASYRNQFVALLESRMEEMSDNQARRLGKLIKKVGR